MGKFGVGDKVVYSGEGYYDFYNNGNNVREGDEFIISAVEGSRYNIIGGYTDNELSNWNNMEESFELVKKFDGKPKIVNKIKKENKKRINYEIILKKRFIRLDLFEVDGEWVIRNFDVYKTTREDILFIESILRGLNS